jgi:hypothetical protein
VKLASIEAIVIALEKAKTRYLVVGGLAVAAHGFGRATFDIDLVVQLHSENIIQAMTALQALGYRPSVPVTANQFADAALRTAGKLTEPEARHASGYALHPVVPGELDVNVEDQDWG